MLLGQIEGADTGEWRRMIDVNLFGVLYCTHAALPLMREAGHGHIVNVSSVAGRIARRARASTTSPSGAWARSPRRCARRPSAAASA
jgi:NADP-dependent 3-hydroxy acid dehydrogenase YdfG